MEVTGWYGEYDKQSWYSILCPNVANFARSAHLPTWLYILLALISSSFFNLSQIISGSNGPNFTIFSVFTKCNVIAWIFSILTSFLFFPWRCHGNRFWTKFAKWPLLNTLAYRNGFEYRNYDLQVLKGTIFATFCSILVKIDRLTSEIMQRVSVPVGTRRQKSTYRTKYLSKYWTELHQLFSTGRLIIHHSELLHTFTPN